MALLYPSVVVALTIRFDDAYHVLETNVPDPVSASDLVGQLLPFSPGKPNIVPLFERGAADNLTQIGAQQPRSGSVELPGFRQAGQFEFTFDFTMLPIDPRLIQAMSVDIYLGLVDPTDFSTGIVTVEPDGSRRSILKPSDDNLLISGVVDEHDVDHLEKSSRLHIKGRDMRGILIDLKVDSRVFRKLDLTRPINEVANAMLHLTPLLKDVVVSCNPDDWPDSKVPSPATEGGVARYALGADGTGKPTSAPPAAGEKVSFWDLLTRLCYLCGAIPYFVGRQLVIRPARSLFDQQKGGTQSAGANYNPDVPTPFLGGLPRDVDVGNPKRKERLRIRRFVFGRNVSRVSFSRKYGGVKVPVIQLVLVDAAPKKRGLQKAVVAQWPPAPKNNRQKAAAVTSVAVSGEASQTEIYRQSLHGITDVKRGTEIARAIWEEIGRGECGGSVSTTDFSSFNSFSLEESNVDPDLLTMRPGDAVQVMVDTRALSSNAPLVAALVDHQRRINVSPQQAIDEISKRLAGPNGKKDKNLAKVIVQTARNGIVELLDIFRTETVKYNFAEGGKVGIDFDFKNFVVPRFGVDSPSLGQNSQPVKLTAARST